MNEAQLRLTTLYLMGLVFDWQQGLPLGTLWEWATTSDDDRAASNYSVKLDGDSE